MKLPIAIACAALALTTGAASAHKAWSNGEAIPAWVTRYCCSKDDVHQLDAGSVHIMQDGYHIDGIKTVVPITGALPSPDGKFWAFFDDRRGDDPPIWCFFAPLNGM